MRNSFSFDRFNELYMEDVGYNMEYGQLVVKRKHFKDVTVVPTVCYQLKAVLAVIVSSQFYYSQVSRTVSGFQNPVLISSGLWEWSVSALSHTNSHTVDAL